MTVGETPVKNTAVRRFLKWVRSVLYYDHWAIGIVEQPIRNALGWTSAPPARWIEPFNGKRYHADPFPWPGSSDTLLCESYDIAGQKGHIAALRITGEGAVDEMKLDLPGLAGHLSFPHLFLLDGRAFLMPESSADRKLQIFLWQEQTGTWVPCVTVFADKAVADATLFEKDGLFWIAYTDVDQGAQDNLNLVYAAALEGPWQPHALNPVRRGADSSRNAGPVFTVDGRFYRPAQDCSDVYGGSIRIMEIAALSPKSYQEKEITHIVPSSPNYPDGIHTLVAWGDVCLIDGMKTSFSGPRLLRKIFRRCLLCCLVK